MIMLFSFDLIRVEAASACGTLNVCEPASPPACPGGDFGLQRRAVGDRYVRCELLPDKPGGSLVSLLRT
jgi:hypothetical protein